MASPSRQAASMLSFYDASGPAAADHSKRVYAIPFDNGDSGAGSAASDSPPLKASLVAESVLGSNSSSSASSPSQGARTPEQRQR